jgi:uncharacterized protein YegP (UPF0339 family)
MIRSWMAGLGVTVLVLGLSLGSAEPTTVPGTSAGPLTFELFKDAKKGYCWRLKAANGKVMALSSDGYTTKASCESAIELIKEGAAKAPIQDLTQE